MALGVAVAAACGGGSGGQTITLGAVAPWGTGYGTQIKRAIDLAVEEVNKSGGINGRPIQVQFKDDSAHGARGVAMAQELVADKSIVAVIGHANSAKAAMLSTMARKRCSLPRSACSACLRSRMSRIRPVK